MLGRALVKPLEDDWLRALDAVATARGWPTTKDASKLGASVAALSASYNDPATARASARDAGAARLGFSFARDVPKGAGAVRELVALGKLGLKGGTLTVLDMGAGLGATTWGVVRALEAAGERGAVEATWVDSDTEALGLALAIVKERQRSGPGPVELRVRVLARKAGVADDLGSFDLVLAGQVLSELDVGLEPAARVSWHAELLGAWLQRRVADGGSLVVIEPALRDRTRHLHQVRGALVAAGATIFAPCLHAAPCPALTRETDWCHEDLTVDLPAGLVPVARAAGLRHEGLTFSYLVLRRDGVTLAGAIEAPLRAGRLRVVSGTMPSKGKVEAWVCGQLQGEGGGIEPGRVRAMRLDRDAAPGNAAWDELRRGDVFVTERALLASKPRVGKDSVMTLAGETESR
jgi:SAM-dependent methyltransferase